MTLRRKTILLMSITLAGLLFLLYVILRTIMITSFASLEQQVTLRNLDRATNSFLDESAHLKGAIIDWSNWDDTYQFVQDGNSDYIHANLTDDTLWALKINLMMFINSADQIVYTKSVDLDPAWQDKLAQTFADYVQGSEQFLTLTTNTATTGFVVVDNQPMLIASHPILHSDNSGSPEGTLIWGERLSPQALAQMSTSLRLSLDLRGVDAPDLPADFRAAQNSLSPYTDQSVAPLDDNTIAGYASLSDIYGQPSLILKTTQNREIYWQGQASLSYFVVALVIVGIVVGIGMLLLLEQLVLSPLAHLSDRVSRIGVNDDFSMRLPIAGRDELARLAAAINTMLNAVSQSRAALQDLNSALESRVAERTLELEHQKSQLQAIMDTMGEGLIYRVDGLIAYVNRAFVELLGYPTTELVGKSLTLLNPLVDSAQTQHYQTTLIRQDGTSVNVAITSTPVDEADDRARRVIIVRDITKELANKKQRDYFFARASHDLRSPLTSLMTRLYLLGKKPEQLDTHLKILNRISSQMLELVNDLLDVSRVEHGGMILKGHDLVLQTIVDEVVEVKQSDAEQKHIQLTADLAETPLHVYGDPMRLNQVITNLVANAIHYTPEGGRIEVTVEAEDEQGSPRAVVHVKDNGIGISAEHLERIFDPFYRVSDEQSGSGLGLYIVKEIVDLHDGEITVSSELGVGTTFTVCLALKSAEKLQTAAN